MPFVEQCQVHRAYELISGTDALVPVIFRLDP